VTGLFHTDTVRTGVPIIFWLRYTNPEAINFNISNGYEISANSGNHIWSQIVGDTSVPAAIPRSNWDLNFAMNQFPGTTKDTLGIIGAKISAPGLPGNFDGVPYGVNIGTINASASGDTICIDSAWFRPGGTWKWAGPAGANRFPTWGGPYCYTVYNVPNLPPEITNCVPQLDSTHCHSISYDFNASDNEGDPYTFELVSGPGAINATTGVWSYTPTLADVGQSLTIVVRANDLAQGPTCSVSINITNQAPQITCPTEVTLVSTGSCKDKGVTATDDCDPIHYTLGTVTGTGSVSELTVTVNANTGVVHFCASSATAAVGTYQVQVYASDTNDSTSCNVPFQVIAGCPYGLQIAKMEKVFQGGYIDVPVDLLRADAAQGLGGFDIVIAYDASALSFQAATLGPAFAACGWEYFTYRFGANGNCGGGCPTGLLHVVGMAETNNGASHPTCFLPATLPATLFNLNFMVSNNLTLNCQYVPIRFYWTDCADNTLSNTTGSQLYISCSVAEFDAPLVNLQDLNAGFPTFLGAQAACDNGAKVQPIRDVDFINGGLDIICSDSIDARGDINQNGFKNEIADAVMFTNYFIHGLSAFGAYVNAAIAASDVNADGIPLSVADLVYQIRVIVGDAQPFPKVAPVAVNYSFDNGVLSVPTEMGAAFVVFEGNVTPTLLANSMKMDYAFDGQNTRVLVYPNFMYTTSMATFQGAFLSANANIVSIEMATPAGSQVVPKMIPTSFGLSQNYPNPFNPSTNISFSLPVASHYTLSIYNVTGQKVMEVSDDAEAGVVTRTVDMSSYASGIYFYKVEAGSFSATKKMVLMK
jgi:hypothetical protein